MNLPNELLHIVCDHYAHNLISSISKDTFIQDMYLEDLEMLRKYKLYHLAKYKEYNSISNEKCSSSLNWAIRYGYLDICEWIIDNTDIHFDKGFLNHPQVLAAAGGHLHIIKWLISKHIYPISEMFDVAAANDQLDILKWLKEKGYTGVSLKTLWYAKNLNNTKIVKWIGENYKL